MPEFLWLLPVGFALGAYGTLIGAGGGFLLVPLLLLLYPDDSPHTIATISLTVVFVNALSGSIAYARMRRIDYKSGLLFSTATVPGAIVGALATDRLPRRPFDLLVGVLMLAICVFLLRRPSASVAGEGGRWVLQRRVVEADGTVHTYAYNPVLGVGVSLVVGFLSSLLGIGGGIIHVPVMANLLHFPVHVATATSHFTLAIMTLAGAIVHGFKGDFTGAFGRIVPLAIGVAAGAQAGALLARWVGGVWIIRALVAALAFVGVRLILLSWQGG
jgi:uncharacterized membrane protein YfcA